MYLIFDTETTGLFLGQKNAALTDGKSWPRCVQIAWQLHDTKGNIIEHTNFLIRPDEYTIPYEAEKIHGISTPLALEEGQPIQNILTAFEKVLSKAKFICGHNVKFDCNIIAAEFFRYKNYNPLENCKIIDVCSKETANICKLSGGRGGGYKLPTLSELYYFVFKENFKEAHNATADVEATARCLFELLRLEKIHPIDLLAEYPFAVQNIQDTHPSTINLIGIKHRNLREASENLKEKTTESDATKSKQKTTTLLKASFCHLHNHSVYSVLQSPSKISEIIAATIKFKMPAVALTDFHNLMGGFSFMEQIKKYNDNLKKGQTPIVPILGCELFVCQNHNDRTQKDNGYAMVFLAKNKKGYFNLSKMSSFAYTEGYYYIPRIDREIVKQYREGIIVLTGGNEGEIVSKILNQGEQYAEEALLWWKNVFQDDLYIEIMRHGKQEEEKRANEVLVKFSQKHTIPLIATNNTFYIEQENSDTHDTLLCIKQNEKKSTSIGRGRGKRKGLPNNEYYYKSPSEMKDLFIDIPEAVINIENLIKKVENYNLTRDIVLPEFEIPEEFQEKTSNDKQKLESNYLKHLTYKGAKDRYKEITQEIKNRIEYELEIIGKAGYSGYFLIVYDIILEVKKMGIYVGVGRGSAAGSIVAYSLGIVGLDPIKYNLLFERFLNPERITMPDIDIDFEDDKRQDVIQYIIKKYNKSNVAQIITYGKMKSKSAIRDAGRIMDLSLPETDTIAKLLPNIMPTTIENLRSYLNDYSKRKDADKNISAQQIAQLETFLKISTGKSLKADVINQAKTLEGSLRNLARHACGIIIAPEEISNLVPIAIPTKKTDKKNNRDNNETLSAEEKLGLNITQFDNSAIEKVGLLKMDILGLSTLSIIKNTVLLIKKRHNIVIDIENIPLDNKRTYQLFQRGDTVAIFQYESLGMQRYLKILKPNVFADLIAMNALYRPGPMQYIPNFIKRKNGEEPITYHLPIMEKHLKETYGVMVYQEQVILLSQEIAGFTKGEADILRKVIGKKEKTFLTKLKYKFIKGGQERKHPKEILEKIWNEWAEFANYAFNKSHSTCYAFIGYQTAYLKANYPAEFMASVLSNNMTNIDKLSFFMQECHKMGVKVLSPDINESEYNFTVIDNDTIRFGLAAIKGLGKKVEVMIENRKKSSYTSIFDLVKRNGTDSINKGGLENLVKAGALDSFKNIHRAQYFATDDKNVSFIEKLIRSSESHRKQEKLNQGSLFGSKKQEDEKIFNIPKQEPWDNLEALKKEKEVIGIYISAHPLDKFKKEVDLFSNILLKEIDENNLTKFLEKKLCIVGFIENVEERVSKRNTKWARVTIQDFSGHYQFNVFGEDYSNFISFLKKDEFIYIEILVKPGYKNPDGTTKPPFLKVIKIEWLGNIIPLVYKKITILFDIYRIEENNILHLKKALQKHKGNRQLRFIINDSKNNTNVEMFSRNHKVEITSQLLENIEEKGWKYHLNK